MSNKLTRKGLAVSSGLAIALTSLVGVAPAQATGTVKIVPDGGSTLAVFNTDRMETTWSWPYEDADLGVVLTNSQGSAFLLQDDATGWDVAYGVTSTGAVFDVSSKIEGASTFIGSSYEGEIVDFNALGVVKVHLGYEEMDTEDSDFDFKPVVFDSEDTSPDIDTDTSSDGYNYASWGDGDFNLGIQVWRETGNTDRSYTSIETSTASDVETIRFYDPSRVAVSTRIERFNDGGAFALELGGDIGFSMKFSKKVNLDQIGTDWWEARLVENGNTTSDTWDYIDNSSGGIFQSATLSGDEDADVRDRLFVVANTSIVASKEYRVDVAHWDAPETSSIPTRFFSSNIFELETGSASVIGLDVSVASEADSNVSVEDDLGYGDTGGTTGAIELRPGVKTFTFTAQLLKADGSDSGTDPDALEIADVPVLLYIYDVSTIAVGSSISSSGATVEIKEADNELVAYGVTDEDGQVSFTVTHSGASAGEGFSFDATWFDETGNIYDDWVDYAVEYAAAVPSVIESDSEIAGGSKVNVGFTVTDQFGQPVSKSGTKALSVLLTGSDSDDLELAAAVDANGRASFTFDNYLEVGATDLLFAEVITGTVSDPTPVGPQADVELYNSPAAASVSVAKNATANVTYKDFVTGAASAAKSASLAADATTYTGTVLDANGAGIPGAVVKVAGTGFLFRNSGVGNYFENSIDVVADSNGKFSVDFWTHEANATGKTLTVTSGGKSATTTVKTYLPTGLDGNNLKFELVMPKNVVKNTTYALVAKLTDKWGNPVATSTTDDKLGVTFQGLGSVEINSSSDEVSRNFGKDGTATVYLRSVKDIAGPGSVSAQLNEAAYRATADADLTDLDVSEITTDATSTVWDETKFSNLIEVDVEVLNAAPAAGKVNVGSFNGKLVVYASGLNGSTISWKVGGVWGKAVASSDFARFDRPTPRRGVTVTVDIYVNGVKQLTKSVVTR